MQVSGFQLSKISPVLSAQFEFISDSINHSIFIDRVIWKAQDFAADIKPKLLKEFPDTKIQCSRAFFQGLMKKLGHTSKFITRINKKRTWKSHMRTRQKWMRLFLKLIWKYRGKNVISIDETAWRSQSNKQKCYYPKGY